MTDQATRPVVSPLPDIAAAPAPIHPTLSSDEKDIHAAPDFGGISWTLVWAVVLLLAAGGTALAGYLRSRHNIDGAVGLFLPALAFCVCVLAACFDAATGHIPNELTYIAIVLGIAVNVGANVINQHWHVHAVAWTGAVPPFDCLLAAGMCFVIAMACVLFANMGGGDAKLLTALGALLGVGQVANLMWWILLVALAYSVINLLIRGRLNGVLRAVMASLLNAIYLRRLDPPEAPSVNRIPLAVPALLALIFARLFPHFWM